jgi:ribulose-phosphate 3-epimerase
MNKKLKLAPSILSADFAALGDCIRILERAGAHMVHFDVMDGHFVPNLSFGLPVLACIRPVTTLPLDVHLLISNPQPYVKRYAETGADTISVHYEAVDDLVSCLKQIKDTGVRPAFAVNPRTPVEAILPFAEHAGLVLLMSVEPGFGGQEFITDTLRKAEALANYIEKNGLALEIEMDGGITEFNLPSVLDAGVDIVVAGAAVIAKTAEETERKVKRFLEVMNL